MGEQIVTPTIPAAGLSAISRPGLRIQARSVKINTGANWVAVQGVMGGGAIPPYTVGFTWPLTAAGVTPQITVTAPPAGTAPLGPAPQTTVTFSDEEVPSNPGVVVPAAPIATIPKTSFTALFNIFTGLARSLFLELWATNNGPPAPAVTIYGYQDMNDLTPFIYPLSQGAGGTKISLDGSSPNAIATSVAFGQGTVGGQVTQNAAVAVNETTLDAGGMVTGSIVGDIGFQYVLPTTHALMPLIQIQVSNGGGAGNPFFVAGRLAY